MSISKKEAKISLVGAGPGATDLITLRGWRALQKADVVLYDALVHPDLLNEAPVTATKIYVGKRANKHRYSQDVINDLLVQSALAKGHVVRLKGGDSFVFGRGHEELTYVQQFGIKVEVIPGISSCIAVPELLHIPVTKRGVSQSFWVLTATTSAGKLSEDIRIAVQSSATLVILMGLRKLPQIIQLLVENGKECTPMMVVQNGSLQNEQKVIGTAKTILEKVESTQLGSPAIIVIGDVVGLQQFKKSFEGVNLELVDF